ncbi:glycosyltransferase family 2 protein [Parabacteroides sp. OttesenSCG-928-N08]|nr:glycosyltransferase family 2 protein [Parabacteroides sp. OttesenSCG-928-N08]
MKRLNACVLIPTYNNETFLEAVLDQLLLYTDSVIVVNDGSTDQTATILQKYSQSIAIVEYATNQGKGYALNRGFDHAESLGYDYVITMDSDGQHFPSDLSKFLDVIEEKPGAMVIGSRQLQQENMPKQNSFANRFSNFWFTLQTGISLPDTQTGYRLYPLKRMKGLRPLTSRYEAELEILVRMAWRNTALIPIPIEVYYAPVGERVSHFRPGVDFIRISLLNTCFVFAAILYGYPSRLIRWLLRIR